MAGDSIDAFLWFSPKGRAGKAYGAAPPIEGETTDKHFRERAALQIKNYTFEFTMQSEGSEEKASGQGKSEIPDPTFAPVKITRVVDKASPMLLKALYLGARYDTAHICQRKAGAHKDRSGGIFWEIELRRVTIDNLNWSATESGELTETLSLRYEGLNVKYYPQTFSGEMERNPSEADHDLKGPEGLKDSKKDGKKDAKIDDSQMSDVVDKVIAELKRRGLIGPSASSAGAQRHGR